MTTYLCTFRIRAAKNLGGLDKRRFHARRAETNGAASVLTTFVEAARRTAGAFLDAASWSGSIHSFARS